MSLIHRAILHALEIEMHVVHTAASKKDRHASAGHEQRHNHPSGRVQGCPGQQQIKGKMNVSMFTTFPCDHLRTVRRMRIVAAIPRDTSRPNSLCPHEASAKCCGLVSFLLLSRLPDEETATAFHCLSVGSLKEGAWENRYLPTMDHLSHDPARSLRELKLAKTQARIQVTIRIPLLCRGGSSLHLQEAISRLGHTHLELCRKTSLLRGGPG